MMKQRHPSTMDHSAARIRSLAEAAEKMSHSLDDHFDDLQDIANLLSDWASVKEGWTLVRLDGSICHIMGGGNRSAQQMGDGNTPHPPHMSDDWCSW